MTPFARRTFAALRIALGWLLLWAFLDKLFGLGFSTPLGQGWVAGVSPTAGFLQHGTAGALAPLFRELAPSALVAWLFMGGLLFGGLSFLLGVGLRVAGTLSAVLFFLMYLAAALPPKTNPVIDTHILQALLALAAAAWPEMGDTWGLGKAWKKTKAVKQHPWLA